MKLLLTSVHSSSQVVIACKISSWIWGLYGPDKSSKSRLSDHLSLFLRKIKNCWYDKSYWILELQYLPPIEGSGCNELYVTRITTGNGTPGEGRRS